MRYIFDICAKPQVADQQQEGAGHDGGGEKAGIAEFLDRAGDENDEGARPP
jgi:hypothetical protein